MKKHHFFIVIFLALLAAGIYIFSTNGKVFSYTYPLDFDSEETTNKINDLAGKGKQSLAAASRSVAELASKITATVSQKSQELISGVVDGAKQEAFKAVKKSVDNELNNLSGVKEINATFPGDIGVSFSIKTGVNTYFSLKNKESEDMTYRINWGDGEYEEVAVAVGNSMILSHMWDKQGDYLVEFRISSSEEGVYKMLVAVSDNYGN